MSREVMQQALEALENLTCTVRTSVDVESGNKAITALRRELEKPADEPVARVLGYYAGRCVIKPFNRAMVMPSNLVLYTGPQPARECSAKCSQWVGLTDEDKHIAFDDTQEASGSFWEFADAIEAKLKEKNT